MVFICNEDFEKICDMTSYYLTVHSQDWKSLYQLAFPTGRDSATFRDKGTEIPSLSRDKGTTGQAQNLATGRDGTGFWQPVPSRPGTSRGTNNFLFCILMVENNSDFLCPQLPCFALNDYYLQKNFFQLFPHVSKSQYFFLTWIIIVLIY